MKLVHSFVLRNQFHAFQGIMIELDVKFSDPYDWESHPNFNLLKTIKKIVKGRKTTKVVTVSEDMSVSKTCEQPSSGKNKDHTATDESDDSAPFAASEFEKNELGF